MKKKTKKNRKSIDLKYFMHNLFVFLNKLKYEPELIVFRKLRGVDAYYEGEAIVIDYRRELIPSLIHEFIHKLHEDWSESTVQRLETKIVNAISEKQVRSILKILGRNL